MWPELSLIKNETAFDKNLKSCLGNSACTFEIVPRLMDKHYCKNVDAFRACPICTYLNNVIAVVYIPHSYIWWTKWQEQWQYNAVQYKSYLLQFFCIGIHYTAGGYCSFGSSVLPQPACPEAGARRGLQLILGLASGCTVRAWIDRCAGWSRSPSQTAPGGTNVEQAWTGRLGAAIGTGAGCGLQPGQEPPGRDENKCVTLQCGHTNPFAVSLEILLMMTTNWFKLCIRV